MSDRFADWLICAGIVLVLAMAACAFAFVAWVSVHSVLLMEGTCR